MGERRCVYRVVVGKPEGRDHLEDPGIGGRIQLKWILRKWVGGHGLERCGSGWGQVADTCECGNELSGSIKCWEFLD
jgi:hypothetical protein